MCRHKLLAQSRDRLPQAPSSPAWYGAVALIAALLLALASEGGAQTFKHLGDIKPVIRERDRGLGAVGLSRNGMSLAVVVPDGLREDWVILYDTETLQETARWRPTKGTGPAALRFSPDGKTLIVLSGDATRKSREGRQRPRLIEFWDIETRKVRQRLPLSSREANVIHLTPDGKTLVALGERHILLIDAVTGKPRARFQEHSDGPSTLSTLSPDGKFLAVRENYKPLFRLYDLTNGKLAASLDPFPKAISYSYDSTMAFTPDSKHLTLLKLSGGELATFAVPGGKEVSRLVAKPTTRPYAMVYARDGKTLILAGGDRGTGVAALSAETGKPTVPKGPDIRGARMVALSASGRMVALAKDGTVHLWRTDTR